MERESTPNAALHKTAKEAPKSEVKSLTTTSTSHSGTERQLIVPAYLDSHGIVFREGEANGYTKYILDECPFDPNHKAPDSMVTQAPDGALGFKCHHDSCSGKHWAEFKSRFGVPSDEHWDPPKTGAVAFFEESNSGSVDSCTVTRVVEGPNVDSIPELKAEPFPVDVLPGRFRQMAESVSQAVGVDVSFAVLPMLTCCSTAIGNSRWVSTKQGNSQPLMLWTAVVGSSGSQKSEPFSHAEEAIREIDSEVIKKWQESLADYETQMKLYKLDFAEWKKTREGDMPQEAERPPRARLVLSDYTYESMVESHAGTPRGITISCEELSAWFGSFDRYGGKGAASPEQARYLQAYDGKSLTSDRISGFRYVPRAFVNVSGTIQPGILAKCFTDESRQNGLASRLWMTYPESIPMRWTDNVVCAIAKANYRRLIRDLWELRPAEMDSDKWPVPTILPFNREAQNLFAEFFNQTGEEAFGAQEDTRAAMTKFIGRCARIAGVLHCCEQVNGDAMDAFEIQPETVERAIKISKWSLLEAHRIYRLLTEPDEVRELRQIAGWLRYRGGCMTARDVARNRRDIETTAHAESVLIQLVKAGLGTWRNIHRSREFVLNDRGVSTSAP